MNNISEVDLKELKKKYQGENLDIALSKIKSGYPVQYLIGDVNFYGNRIKVNESVLIPRFETEFLVDLFLKKVPNNYSGKILDLCTGSGCIAISIAKRIPTSNITGIDISSEAINVAKENKNINNVNNVIFKVQDLYSMENYNDFNIIISNPPYVSHSENVGLETKYEPQIAIFADNDGLCFYEEIIKKASLSTNITDIFFEIGMNQFESIKLLKEKYLKDYSIDVHKDLANKDRYIHIHMNK